MVTHLIPYPYVTHKWVQLLTAITIEVASSTMDVCNFPIYANQKLPQFTRRMIAFTMEVKEIYHKLVEHMVYGKLHTVRTTCTQVNANS